MAREWLVDPECYELAKRFLPNGPETSLRELSQDIQDAVEDWFDTAESQALNASSAGGQS